MNSRKVFIKSRSLLLAILAWEIAAGVYMLIRFMGTKDAIDWASSTPMLFVVWFAAGLMFGVIYWISSNIAEGQFFRQRSYGFLIMFKTSCMFCGAVLILLFTRVVAVILGKIEPYEIMLTFHERVEQDTTIAFLIYLLCVSALYSFIRQMRFMIGDRTLLNLILGKYHKPKAEDRIFMFLDLKSSTKYAEQLGHDRFCLLIQDCFRDLTDSAIKHQVEIYQYVGDEAILTWTIKNGVKNAKCIDIFFDFEEILRSKRSYYKRKYGLNPQFKAGVNTGSVMVAEVGVIKRDIAYLSDVLNTASRIQEVCNEYGRKLLISSSVKELLQGDIRFMYEYIGNIALRGKENSVDIFSVEKRVEMAGDIDTDFSAEQLQEEIVGRPTETK